jgi:enterochelin esterase-like enzyme
MQKLILLFTGILLASACNQKPTAKKEKAYARVTFLVEAEQVEEQEAVFIAGSHPELGNWQADKVRLEKNKEKQWKAVLKLPKGQPLEFKFTKGKWEKEAADEKGTPFPNAQLITTKDTTVEISIKNWKTANQTSFKGQITGTVKYHKNLTAKGLHSRNLIVWLPPGYENNPKKHYPVLYMHDGQNIFDPKTSSFGTDWQLDETADSLIRNESIEPIIIVGIYNTKDRSAEYLPGDTARRYMNFMVNAVKPLIDRTYRTLPDREHTATGGSSAGGILSFMLAWEYPEVFSKAMCMSPAFKIEHIDYVKEVLAYEGRQKDILIYADNGGVGLEKKLQPGIDEMLEALQQKGYVMNQDLFWVQDEKAEHSEKAWAQRAGGALELFYGLEAI